MAGPEAELETAAFGKRNSIVDHIYNSAALGAGNAMSRVKNKLLWNFTIDNFDPILKMKLNNAPKDLIADVPTDFKNGVHGNGVSNQQSVMNECLNAPFPTSILKSKHELSN